MARPATRRNLKRNRPPQRMASRESQTALENEPISATAILRSRCSANISTRSATRPRNNEFVQARSVNDGQASVADRAGAMWGTNISQANYAAATSTPTVDGEYLYALGSDGDLASIREDGRQTAVAQSLRADFAGKPGPWAYAESLSSMETHSSARRWVRGYSRQLSTGTRAPFSGNAPSRRPMSRVLIPRSLVSSSGTKQCVQLAFQRSGSGSTQIREASLALRQTRQRLRRANIPTPVAAHDYIYVASAGTGGGAVHLTVKDGKFVAEEAYFSAKNPLPSAASSNSRRPPLRDHRQRHAVP